MAISKNSVEQQAFERKAKWDAQDRQRLEAGAIGKARARSRLAYWQAVEKQNNMERSLGVPEHLIGTYCNTPDNVSYENWLKVAR